MKTTYILYLIRDKLTWRGITIITASVLFLLTSMVPPGAASMGQSIPSRPNASGLNKVVQGMKQDLAVENLQIRTRTDPKTGKTQAAVSIRIHNIGSVMSLPDAVSFSLRPAKGRPGSKLIKIPSLPANGLKELSWTTPVEPGSCTVTARIKDPGTPANNVAVQTFYVKKTAKLQTRKLPVSELHSAPVRKIDKRPRPFPADRLLRPDLTVSNIVFNDFKAKKPNETWVEVEVRNIGKLSSPATTIRGSIKRADGSTERKSFPLSRLRAGEKTIISGPIRLSPGINTLTMQVIDPATPANNTLTRRHRFGLPFRTRDKALPLKKNIPTKDVQTKNRQIEGKLPHSSILDKNGIEHAVIGQHRIPAPNPLPDDEDPPGPPDLKILTTQLTPDPPVPGREIRCTVEVVNLGGEYPDNNSGKITGELTVTGPLGREPVQPASAVSEHNGRIRIEFRYRVPVAGQYHNRVRIFFDSSQEEINLGNTTKEWAYKVLSLPDLSVWMSRPNDVRVGGPKRWFRLLVRNIGEAPSQKTNMRLHIDGDGDHTYEVPALAPGETFPAGHTIQRGIRWWKQGRKHYQLVVNPEKTFIESDRRNNLIKDSLQVYLPEGLRFDPVATVHHLPVMYKKKQPPLSVGVSEHIVFRVQNKSHDLTEAGKFVITVFHPDPLGTVSRFEVYVNRMFPGESFYKRFPVRFNTSGRATYTISRYLKKEHRGGVEYESFDQDVHARGDIKIKAPLGDPARTEPQLGQPPRSSK